ncbi:hypothetical protein [Paenibacillus sp. LjRoot56]|uniref:hypothetical protein n=1 Tax=Paenibacillus sp. LjRoot56 TaxID=3342333 RepID=UPI003ECC8745
MKILKVGFQNREGWAKGGEGGTERSDVLREYRTSRVSFKIRCRDASRKFFVIKVAF